MDINAEVKLGLALKALQEIRDSTYRNAVTLRAIAADSIDQIKEIPTYERK